MVLLSYIALLTPLTCAAIAAVLGWCRTTSIVTFVGMLVVTGCGIALSAWHTYDSTLFLYSLLRIDAVTSYMTIVVGVVGAITQLYAVRYINAELVLDRTNSRRSHVFAVLFPSFLAAMLLSLFANNLGILWVAIEATTVTTAFLVVFNRTPASLEAAWKYVVIGSVGLALAFLGVVLFYFATRLLNHEQGTLSLVYLTDIAQELDPRVIRIAGLLALLGFGTKVGLAPMHTWLPDAHSQAPAPVSALMSGVLLSVAFVAILRIKVVVDAALGPELFRNSLFVLGLLSVAIAVLLTIGQRDYKRLLAYSSIEHMGVLSIGAAIGTPVAITAVLLHIFGHALIKSALFCTSGEFYLRWHSTQIADVSQALKTFPNIARIFAVGMLAIVAFPPFVLFITEVTLVIEGIRLGYMLPVITLVVLLLVMLVAVSARIKPLLLGTDSEPITTDDFTTLNQSSASDPSLESSPHDVLAMHTPLHTKAMLLFTLCLAAGLGLSTYPIDSLLRACTMVIVP